MFSLFSISLYYSLLYDIWLQLLSLLDAVCVLVLCNIPSLDVTVDDRFALIFQTKQHEVDKKWKRLLQALFVTALNV